MKKERKENVPTKKGVVFALVKNRKILLEEQLLPGKPFSGYVIIPGGGIKKGETRENALFREISEESKVEPTRFELLGSFTREENGILNTRYLYLVLGWIGIPTPDITIDGHKQFFATFDEARRLCRHPLTQEFLDVIEAYLKANEIERPLD